TLNPYYHNPHAQNSYIITCIPRETDREIISQIDIAIIATDEKGIIMQVNRHALELFGYGEDELDGTSVHLLLPPNYRQKHEKYFKRFSDSSLTEVPMGKRPEIAGYCKDGSLFPAEASISKFQGKKGWIFVATLRDITKRKKAEKQLTWQATHDPLTSLPNREMLRDRMNNALQRSKQTGENIALLFIDLDNFKLINDSYDHDFGDQLLITVAKRLTNHVRPGDTVARFGGDEFVILCEQVADPAEISTLAMRINDFLRAPVLLAGQKNFLTSSIGIAIGHGSTHSSEQLLRNADTAMYLAKDQGKDGWRFYNESIHEQAKQQLSLSSALRGAIEREKFSLFLQPIVDTSTGKIQGAEALLRWHHQGNFVPPNIFIPIAETTGIISKIGYWVFEEGCRQLATINKMLSCDTSFYISINVSARQLNDENLVDNFHNIIEKNGVLSHQILLEITETSLMADVELNLKILIKLSALGLKVAVDDFGTGYSSLSQLLRLPVNHLKIDRLFISQMEFREENRTVVTAIITMAHALGLQVIAEGVETEQQHILLNEIGCDFIQGFYFYKPMPFDNFMPLLTPAFLNATA
ncbi:MAG: EAL domain-containing protein, partial [Candidatus Electrothrix sp. GM3_4]|nr:EAL domain-containing protein [Candidatus Electrothrix sp. GM3_4]